MTTRYLRKLTDRSPLRRSFPVILLALAFTFALSPARAVDPPPDGGYPGGNTAEGENALLKLTTGTVNTATGVNALQDNTTGSGNTAIGGEAMRSNRTGSLNTAVGYWALLTNTAGTENTAVGVYALVAT